MLCAFLAHSGAPFFLKVGTQSRWTRSGPHRRHASSAFHVSRATSRFEGSFNAGDMPIVLTVDGPSLGGFVCPLTTVVADMWKWGHVRPGDTIYFQLTTLPEALRLRQEEDARVSAVSQAAQAGLASVDVTTAAVRAPSTS